MNLTTHDINNLKDAIQLAINSNKRNAQNKRPEFKAVIEKIDRELTELLNKVSAIEPKK